MYSSDNLTVELINTCNQNNQTTRVAFHYQVQVHVYAN